MKIYETKTKKTKQVRDIVCDRCGMSLVGQYINHLGENLAGVHFSISNYDGSPSFCYHDNKEIITEYDVCYFCIKTWIKSWPKKKE